MTLFSDHTGVLEAVIDFHLVTKWKTAADSLLASRKLAPPATQEILLIGAGTMAAALLDAYRCGFPDARFSVWNRTHAGAEKLAARYTGVSVADNLAEAVTRADLVVCATATPTPLLRGAWLRPGQHIDLVGAYRSDMREADDETLQRSHLFVDSYATTLDHIGELKLPLETGAIRRADVRADFYDLAAFTRTPDDITVFKNGGGAHLDLMTGRHILERCS